MIHSSRFTAVLDANVLYPAPLRDFLLSLADLDLYKPKWTDKIQDEWIENLLENRTDLTQERLERTRQAMESAFPDASIINYEELIPSMSLPDPDDRHILAAAVREGADVIVTFNLKDFPPEYLKTYDIEVQHPDEFVFNLIGLNITTCLEALNNQVKRLKNPSRTINEVLQALEENGLVKSVQLLRDIS